MRMSLKWAAVGTTVAAAVLAAAGTAGAATTPAKAATMLSIGESAAKVVPGGGDVISGTLTSAGKPVSGVVVWLEKEYKTRTGAVAFAKVEAKLTDGVKSKTPGKVAFDIHPAATGTFELAFPGNKTLAASTSGTVTVTVAKLPTTLSITAAKGIIKVGATDTISGTLSATGHKVPGQVVWLEKEYKGTFVKVEAKLTDGPGTKTPGAVSFTVKPEATTTYELVFPGTKVLAASKSAADTITVTK